MKKPLRRFVLVLSASLLLTGATLPELSVQVQAGKLTVHAESVPLYGVLWAISAQTGIKVNIPGGTQSTTLAELLVTDDFTDLSLEQGIAHLLGKHLKSGNYVIITDKQTGLPQSVHILAGPPSTPASSVTSVPSSPAELPDWTAPDITIEQALDAAKAAATPEEKVKALRALGKFQDPPRTLEVLRPALRSDKAEIREAALEAMRWGRVEDKATLAEVRAMVTSDSDPAVRKMGLEVITLYDDQNPETHALLKKLAAEEGGAYRDFARRELERIEMEAQARSLPDPQLQQVQ
ncbi:MAG TPA: HEAT repeat domain-containing protein [Candidatus Binatia bacterium]|jgi:hypothetical protein|nr:HEAT repeat domain-containing protein [Candidatus Binatia bacterium]